MTNASIATLVSEPGVAREWLPRIQTRKYDSGNKPPVQKAGLTIGMGMTEKQGGTDVRANISSAYKTEDGLWAIEWPQMVYVCADV